MNREESNRVKEAIRKRLNELHSEDCPFCGGYHQMRLSLDGTFIEADAKCCDEILRQANKIIRDVRKKCGDPYFQD